MNQGSDNNAKTDASAPVCDVCNDTHQIEKASGATVMCTSCPVPCEKCRAGGKGAFCGTTPCGCECHGYARILNPGPLPLEQRLADALARAEAAERERGQLRREVARLSRDQHTISADTSGMTQDVLED